MIKGLAITPPVVGRIAIGKVVERNGKRLPQKDNEFTITTQVQTPDGWVLHPLDAQLRQGLPAPADAKGKEASSLKLRSIPVRVLFNDPDLNLRADYCLFDRRTGRAECVGNGETCKRLTPQGLETLPCPSPDQCPHNVSGLCKPYGRLNVLIEPPSGETTWDEMGSFVFRTTGYNSIRTLAARLKYLAAASGGQLAHLPLELKLRGKSTQQSHRTPIYYVDLVVRSGLSLAQAVEQAQAQAESRHAAGVQQAALDQAAREGLANGMFEDTSEEVLGVMEEFFPETVENPLEPQQAIPERIQAAHKASLAQKLALKAQLDAPTGQNTSN